MMRGILALALLLALASCGDGSSNEVEADSAPPQGYYIRKVDLYRDSPNDVCRVKDAAFLETLISRATDALPAGMSWVDLEDFNARAAVNGEGKEAVLRFRVRTNDAGPVMMFAVGSFDPATCAVGPMKGGVGSDPNDPKSTVSFAERR